MWLWQIVQEAITNGASFFQIDEGFTPRRTQIFPPLP
jgi:hypothetical protein